MSESSVDVEGTKLQAYKKHFFKDFGVMLTIVTLVNIGLGGAELAIGAKYSGYAVGLTTNVSETTNDVPKTMLWCQAQHNIPTYLLVSGAVCHLLTAVIGISSAISTIRGSVAAIVIFFVFDLILGFFSFAWSVAGSVWIYGIKDTFSSDPSNPDNYCQPTLYWFAFWVTTVSWILKALVGVYSGVRVWRAISPILANSSP